MKYIELLKSGSNQPRLIPNFKQPERKLLSVFLSLLSLSPQVRAGFLRSCGYNSGLTCKYYSAMEVSYKGSQVPDVRPDGLIACQKGKASWAAFIEAKAEKNQIRTDQITSYLELAKITGVENVITISNEFARVPDEPPYHLDAKKSRGVNVFHFSWADIRTELELMRNSLELKEIELGLLDECLEFFWDEKSGVLTYDAMPENWPAFVEAASTALGFNVNIKGLSEVVYGWQQERRDLCSKLTHQLGMQVDLRHQAGVRATDDERTKTDRQYLANDYKMFAHYFFKQQRLDLEVMLDLRACRMTAALAVPIPPNKGVRAIVTWLTRVLNDNPLYDASIFIDWPGRGKDDMLTVSQFLAEPEVVLDGQKASPKGIQLILSRHGVRSFKSRKKVISDLEDMVLDIAEYGSSVGWL